MLRQNKAFTLIELLVVISIVALLASIVLASLNTSREKGRIGGARYFASQVDHVAGEQAVGIWNFDECSGSSVKDASGFANNGSLTGSQSWPTDTFSNTGCYLSFDGSTNYGNFGNGSSLNITGSFTISLWVRYTDTTTYGFIFSKSQNGSNGFELFRQNVLGSLRFSSCNGAGSCADPYFDFTTPLQYNDGKWHHVAAVYDMGTKAYIYVDGVKVATSGNNPSAAPLVSSSNLYIGTRGPAPAGGSFNGAVDNVRLYAKALIASDIENLYAQDKLFYLVANP